MDFNCLLKLDLDKVSTDKKLIESTLKELTFKLEREIREGNNQIRLESPVTSFLCALISTLDKQPDTEWSIYREIFRLLRNSIVSDKINQTIIREQEIIIQKYEEAVHYLTQKYTKDQSLDEDSLSCLRACLQFSGNFMIENSENAKLMSQLVLDSLISLTSMPDEKVIDYAFMNIQVILKLNPDTLNSIDASLLMANIIKQMNHQFALFTFEELCKNVKFFLNIYSSLPGNLKADCLSLINSHELCQKNIPKEVVTTLSSRFKSQSDQILKSISSTFENSESEAREFASLLQLLSILSVDNSHSHLKEDESLITTTIFLLKAVTQVGTSETPNAFTPIEKLEMVSSSSLQPHDDFNLQPSFLFKAHLIRLIANLVHLHEKNQNLTRELQGLSIILDCTRMDARNPFIIQWSVLAIRNLCEGNHLNQAFIQSMAKKGVVQSPVLQEFGITLKDSSCNTFDGKQQ